METVLEGVKAHLIRSHSLKGSEGETETNAVEIHPLYVTLRRHGVLQSPLIIVLSLPQLPH